jgi:superoxide dismutase
MMTPKLHNSLRFYTLKINESPEMAESMAQDIEDKFNSLNKYAQMVVANIIDIDGWEAGIVEIDKELGIEQD